ncbi:hypothetical protein ACLMJK_002233 [Lecanora helva]
MASVNWSSTTYDSEESLEPSDIPQAPYPSIVQAGYAVQGLDEDLNFPFLVRHKFLGWLVLVLEAAYNDYARGQGFFRGKMEMSKWSVFFQREDKLAQSTSDYGLPFSKREIYKGTEQIRHASVHRDRITMDDLKSGMTLPRLLRDTPRRELIDEVYRLVRRSLNANDEAKALEILEDELSSYRKVDSTSALYTKFMFMIESALFRYSQRYHPDLLALKGWVCPEQGEMPQWKYSFRYSRGFDAEQDVFLDSLRKILKECLWEARLLRNRTEHRNMDGDEQVAKWTHRSIKCLLVLGDSNAALEVEILAEQWLTKVSRNSVLRRLQEEYLLAPLPEEAFALRREKKRRSAIAAILQKASSLDDRHEDLISCVHPLTPPSTPDSDWETFDWRNGAPESSSDLALPDRIILTFADDRPELRETISGSMHPKLQAFPEPSTGVVWTRQHPDRFHIGEARNPVDKSEDTFQVAEVEATAGSEALTKENLEHVSQQNPESWLLSWEDHRQDSGSEEQDSIQEWTNGAWSIATQESPEPADITDNNAQTQTDADDWSSSQEPSHYNFQWSDDEAAVYSDSSAPITQVECATEDQWQRWWNSFATDTTADSVAKEGQQSRNSDVKDFKEIVPEDEL